MKLICISVNNGADKVYFNMDKVEAIKLGFCDYSSKKAMIGIIINGTQYNDDFNFYSDDPLKEYVEQLGESS